MMSVWPVFTRSFQWYLKKLRCEFLKDGYRISVNRQAYKSVYLDIMKILSRPPTIDNRLHYVYGHMIFVHIQSITQLHILSPQYNQKYLRINRFENNKIQKV